MSQKGLAPIGIVLLVAAVAIGGYLIYSGKANLNQQTSSTPTTTPASTTNSNETVDWKIYTSTDHKFSIKYPNEAKISEWTKASEGEDAVILSITGSTQYQGTEFHDGIILKFSSGLLEQRTLKEFVDNQVKENTLPVIAPVDVITVNGLNGYTYTLGGTSKSKIIYLPNSKSDYIKIENVTEDPTNKGFKETTNQILSTFKFTN